MRVRQWSVVGLMLGLILGGVAPAAVAQVPPNTWHPYLGAPNCIQVGDSRGNFNCFPGITIDPITGAVGGLAGGGTVSTSGSPANHQTSIFSAGAIITGVGPGTSGQVLTSNGAGADPSYQTLAGGGNLSATTPTNHGVMLGQGSQTLGVTTAGSAGQCLTSNGASSDPTFQACGGGGSGTVTNIATTAPLGGGPITTTGTLTCLACLTATTPTNHGVLLGAGTQAVGATAAGTSGQVLTSNGSSADPTFQTLAGGGNVTSGTLTVNTIPKATGASAINNSALTDDGTTLTYGGTSFVVAGSGTGTIVLPNNSNANTSTIQSGVPASNLTWTWMAAQAAGVLHDNGSGVLSSSTIVAADIAANAVTTTTINANAVTSAKLAVVNTRKTCEIVIGADNGSALADADIGPQNDQCFVNGAATVVEVMVKADAGTPSALPRKTSVAASNTSLLSGALSTGSAGVRACSNTGGTTSLDGTTTCTNTLTTTSLAVGDTLGVASGTAGGTAKRVSVFITYTIN